MIQFSCKIAPVAAMVLDMLYDHNEFWKTLSTQYDMNTDPFRTFSDETENFFNKFSSFILDITGTWT